MQTNSRKRSLAAVASFLFLLSCTSEEPEPNRPVEPEVPDISLQVTADEYVPMNMSVNVGVQMLGMGVPDSLVVFRGEQRLMRYVPSANPDGFFVSVSLSDTLEYETVRAEAWWQDSLLASASDSVLALSFALETSAPESVYVNQLAQFSATISHPLLFNQVRIRAAGLDTVVVPSQTLAPFTLSLQHAYDDTRADTVKFSARLHGGTAVERQSVLRVLEQPEEPWIAGELLLTNTSGMIPLTVQGQILAYPERFVDSVRFADGTGWDTLIIEPDSSRLFALVYLQAGEYEARLEIFGADSLLERTARVWAWEQGPITYSASFSVTPSEGDAPLFSQMSFAVESSRHDTLQIVLNRGVGADSLFARVTPFTILLGTTYEVGDYEASIAAVGADTTLEFTQQLHSVNTSPELVLPTRSAYEDSSMASVDLDGTAHDQQTPDSLLSFQILSQNGPAAATLENHVLNFSLQPEASGPGSVSIRVTDGNGASTDRTLNYTVLPMTDLRVRLADLETLEPLQNGIVNINGQDYHFSGDELHTQLSPGGIIPVRAVHTLNEAINSFERTADINTAADRDTTILVSTYDALQQEGVTPFRYGTYIDEGRVGPALINGEVRFVLKKINFTNAHLGFENGGYTWWIGKTNPENGLVFSDEEQLALENIILSQINPNIMHDWARPPSQRATLQDSSYFIPGYGTTRDGLIPNYKSNWGSSIGSYDRNFDGIIESVFIQIYLNQNPIATLQENLSALAFPNEVGLVDSTLHPHETALHLATTRTTMSRLDIKSLNEAINLPDAEELDRVYHFRQ